MIVKMKKISLVSQSQRRTETVKGLKGLGLVHVEFVERKDSDLDDLLSAKETLERASLLLPEVPDQSHPAGQSAQELAGNIMQVIESQRNCQEEIEKLQREYDRIETWGNFSPHDIVELREKGVMVRLFQVPKDQLSRFDSYFVIHREKSYSCVAVISNEVDAGDSEEFRLPELSLEQLAEKMETQIGQIDDFSASLKIMAQFAFYLRQEIGVLEEKINFARVSLSIKDQQELCYITGYLPADNTDELKDAAGKNGWALLIRDPESGDPVPTLVKNPKPVGIISPVFRMLGVVPGYREYDISFLFLLFFSLFFAMIIGDGGYGCILLGVTLFALFKRTAKGKPAGPELILMTVLSSCTIVWGAISGTWFGSEAIAQAAPFRYLILPGISSFDPKSSQTVKYFCFIIGTAHILIAHLWNFIAGLKERPRIRAVAQLGWLTMVAGIYYLVLNLVLDAKEYPLPSFTLWMLVGGLTAVILFSEQQGNFFKGILRGFSGLMTTFLDGIGAFADIISYIRLFAVGLATVEIAKSFNGMASEMGSSVGGIIGAVLVLILGHSLNLAMGALSVVVHGIRLNMLEFSGHLGMEWTGLPYTPFGGKKTN